MKCQICNGKLDSKKAGSTEIIKCGKCGGFWVKKGDLNRLVAHKYGDIEFSSIDHHMHNDTHGIMKCIFCEDSAMIKSNFIEYSDIVLDYCENCGAFWVDNGELEKMQSVIKKIENANTKPSIVETIMDIIYSLPKL